MRKFLGLLCICCLLFTTPAFAGGLFAGLLPNRSTEELPDYGVFMGVQVEDIQTLPDGRIACVYYNVSQQDFEDFGSYLFEAEYTLTGSEYGDSCVYVTLEKGDLIFCIEYVWTIPAMSVIYPSDSVPSTIDSVSAAPLATPGSGKNATPTRAPDNSVCRTCSGLDECLVCAGEGELFCTGGCIKGRCIACDDGKYLYDFDLKGNPKYRDCSYCTGGRCNECGGDGFVDCRNCVGGACPTCGGKN